MNLRRATADDFEEGMELGRRMHEESEFAFLPFDREKVRAFLRHIAANPRHYCAFVVEHEGRLVGLLVGQVMEYFFCRELLSDDVLLFVERDQRGSLAALALVRAYLEWSRSKGAREAGSQCRPESTSIGPAPFCSAWAFAASAESTSTGFRAAIFHRFSS